MQFPSRFFKKSAKLWSQLNLSSLRLRLTVGIAAFSALGLGSVDIWTSWKMQQLLIDSHKHSIEQIAKRFPQDVEVYSEMLSIDIGLQKAVDNLTTTNTLIWVKRPDGTISAQSKVMNDLLLSGQNEQNNNTIAALTSLTDMPSKPLVYQLNGHYWVVCSSPLEIKSQMLGKLYVVEDITSEQTMFFEIVRNLGIASLVSILSMLGAIAFYVNRALQPLRLFSQLAGTISASDLGQARLQLDRAPSEVKELAQTFNTMLSRLWESWEQQRQFVSNISHELRTPLTIVSGYLQSLQRRSANLTESQREALTIASLETERIIRLLGDLLNLARADNKSMLFKCEPFVLDDLVADVAGMAQQFSNRQMVTDGRNFPTEVIADRNYLKQVLLNLIDNAVKYSASDTPVTLKFHSQGEQVIIQVCDFGCGIPLQQQTRIFERFYRVDEARTSSTDGYGLGLSIVKTFVEGMGGTVSVHSQLGEGSTFTITLPGARS